ncbi:DUF1661 domain-containing protein [Porphyromonas gingivalis]|nr:DUF1661 domain-containing protein [Porphyromonas gingivalis]
MAPEVFRFGARMKKTRAKTEKKSRVFCRKTEPQFLLFRCVFL